MQNLEKLLNYLFLKYQHLWTWWPWESKVEIMISAVLTQLSKREQVEKVLNNLKGKYKIFKKEFYDCNVNLNWEIEKRIAKYLFENLKEDDLRWVWFYKRKYDTIKNLLKRFLEIDVSLHTIELRKQLLAIKWIGKETADAILCYWLNKKIFVVDEYTYRVVFSWMWKDGGWMGRDEGLIWKDDKESVKEYYKKFKKQWKYDKLRIQIEDILKVMWRLESWYFKNLHWAFVEEGKILEKKDLFNKTNW